jgi:SAM-dependent methyltransferase
VLAPVITADQERGFYDSFYGQYLAFPDEELRCDRTAMRRYLADPAHPLFERRRLYGAVLDALLALPLKDASVLDYGCGTGDWGVLLATEGASVTLLDLSSKAIEVGLRRARIHGVADRVRGAARDATDLTCFRDGEFDLVYANAAVHHTLKYPNAVAELTRVIRPGGRLMLAETYGNNPLLNTARRLRWWLAGEAAEQGEDILLSDRELALLRPHFATFDVRPLTFLAMAKRLFRGRFTHAPVRGAVRGLEEIDRALLTVLPFLRHYCGEVIVIAQKSGGHFRGRIGSR